jgi:hypothetical protein
MFKIVDDVAKVNPALSQAIHDYFVAIPSGQPDSPGVIAFERGIDAVDSLAAQSKLDLDKVQIEEILLDLVKKDVMPKFGQNAPPTPPSEQLSVAQFEGESPGSQATDVSLAIIKIVNDVATVNPALSKAIHDYFLVTPQGKPEATGLLEFWVRLQDLQTLAKQQGKLALLDNIQIKTILLDLVKANVMPKFAKNAPPQQ